MQDESVYRRDGALGVMYADYTKEHGGDVSFVMNGISSEDIIATIRSGDVCRDSHPCVR